MQPDGTDDEPGDPQPMVRCATSVLPHSRGAYGPPLPLARTLGAWYRRGPAIRNLIRPGQTRRARRSPGLVRYEGPAPACRLGSTALPGRLRTPSATCTHPRPGGIICTSCGRPYGIPARPGFRPLRKSIPLPAVRVRAPACKSIG